MDWEDNSEKFVFVSFSLRPARLFQGQCDRSHSNMRCAIGATLSTQAYANVQVVQFIWYLKTAGRRRAIALLRFSFAAFSNISCLLGSFSATGHQISNKEERKDHTLCPSLVLCKEDKQRREVTTVVDFVLFEEENP